MIGGDRKRTINGVLGPRKGQAVPPPEDKEKDGAAEACAQELIDAVKNEDTKGVVSAMRALVMELAGNKSEE